MKKYFLVLPLLVLMASGCSNNPGGDSTSIIDGNITVNFYIDYNAKIAKEVYYTCTVKNGDLITEKPNNPAVSPYNEFPTFLGWSKKEIVDDTADLWDFSSDHLRSEEETFSLFGIWVSENA